MEELCAATLQLTSDLGSGSPLAEALLRPPRRESQLTLLQLDRSQFLPLAALQLLRHTASGGASCGALRLLHEHDSPELRLDLTGQSEPGVLARPCVPQAHGNTDSGLVWLGRYLDYRCHIPQQPGTVRLPAPLRRCLQSLARSRPGSRVVADALGADDAMEIVIQKSNLADPDTSVAADHVRVFLKWFRAELESAFLDSLGGAGAGSDDEEEEEAK